MEPGETSYLVDREDPLFQTLCRNDLAHVRETRLFLEHYMLDVILIRSVYGHALQGVKKFGGVSFPNATLSDVVVGAGLDLDAIKGTGQRVIDNFREWLELVKKSKTNRLMLKGKPLFGFYPFKDPKYTIDPETAIKAVIQCGLMDSAEWRKKTSRQYTLTVSGDPLEMGIGKSYLVDINKLAEVGYGVRMLASEEIPGLLIDQFRKKGIITSSKNPNAESAYILRKKGFGTSDDCSFILLGHKYLPQGELYARTAFLAGFGIDEVDTIEKLVSEPIEGGYDELIAKKLYSQYRHLVTPQDITTLIYCIAKGNGKNYLVSSSHKKLVQEVSSINPIKPAILHHLDFLLSGKIKEGFNVGSYGMGSKDFYKEVKHRIACYNKYS